jgi:hypothetical protein
MQQGAQPLSYLPGGYFSDADLGMEEIRSRTEFAS